jgi:gamma-glutamylputrescine oxidase
MTYYRATADSTLHFAPLDGQRVCETVVVGGGFAGLATAMSLLERGHRDVCVLEADRVGFGASGRNGGFVFGGFSLDNALLVDQLGPAGAKALYRLTLDAVDCIRRRMAAHQIDCEANESGVILANWFDDADALKRQQAFLAEHFGVEWEFRNTAQTRELLASPRYFQSLHERQAFHFHPLKYVQGLAKVLQGSGVAVHEHSRVLGIQAQDGQWRLETARGSLRAQNVVVTCGGYIDRLVPGLARAMLPIATYVVVTEPLGERLQAAMRVGAAVYDTRFAFDYYRPLPDSRLLWGGRISVRDRTAADVAKLLVGDLLRVYPQLRGVRVEYAWSGLMSYARHQMPQIGRLPNGLWFAMGFGGHGVAPTTLAGEVLARCISEQAPVPEGFARYGLPPTHGMLGLAAAQATYWALQLRDWLRE